MSWIDKSERKFGRFAIHRIVRPILAMQVLVYILLMFTNGWMWVPDGDRMVFNENSLQAKLYLNPVAVADGEVWRLFSFLVIPPTKNVLFMLIGVMFTLFVSESLENLWGAFRMNLYVVAGWLFLAGGSMILLGSNIPPQFLYNYLDVNLLMLSLFLAFAVLFPEYEVLAMAIIPIKAKWLGLISGALVGYWYLDTKFSEGRVLIIIGLMNFFVFVIPRAVGAYKMKSDLMARRRRFEEAKAVPDVQTFHECSMCGKSEVDDRELEFRVASDGNEYCVPCLKKKREEEETSGDPVKG